MFNLEYLETQPQERSKSSVRRGDQKTSVKDEGASVNDNLIRMICPKSLHDSKQHPG